jgi:hypothetical protein
MSQSQQNGHSPGPGGVRRAAFKWVTQNVLISLCVAVIVLTYLIGLLNLDLAHRHENYLGVPLLLALLFTVLDMLVFVRLRPAVWEAVTRRLAPGIGRALLRSAAILALGVAVVVFFFATCLAMIQVF